MLVEKQPNGSILISDFVNQQFIKKVYYFTPLAQAKKDFRAYCRQISANWAEYLAK